MTRAPHLLQQSRTGFKMGDVAMQDSMLVDGLVDAFNGVHMGVTAERLARKYQITRDEQDQFALESQQKAGAAMAAGRFADEIVPVEVATQARHRSSSATTSTRVPTPPSNNLASLRPIFDAEGSVTAGNSSGLNDGAAALLVMSSRRARRTRAWSRWCASSRYASAGVDPMEMGLGPVPATRAALAKAGWTLADIDLVELNEAFAAQSHRGQSRARPRSGDGSTSMAAPSPSATRSAAQAPARGDADSRNAAARRPQGPRDDVHRRRPGRRHLPRALAVRTSQH